MASARERIESEWVAQTSSLKNSQLTSWTSAELNRSLLQFPFFFRRRYTGSELNAEELAWLLEIIRNYDLSTVSPFRLTKVLESVILTTLQTHLDSPFASACQQTALEINLVLIDHSTESLLRAFSVFAASLRNPRAVVLSLLNQAVQELAFRFPLWYFKNYLPTSNLYSLSPNLLTLPQHTVTKLIQEISSSPPSTSLADPDLQVWQLANFISITSAHPVTKSLLQATHCIVSRLTVCIVSGAPDALQTTLDDSDSEEDYISRRSRQQELDQNNTIQFKTRNQYLLSVISTLYSQSFVESVMDILLPDINETSNLLASLFVSLGRIYPRKKQELSLYISLIPPSKVPGGMSVSLMLWTAFKRSQLYLDGSDHILGAQEIDKFAQTHLNSLTQLVFILELVSYWLIVTDDSEFHNSVSSGGPSLAEIKNISLFIKNLAYTFIWNWPTISTFTSLDSSFLTFEKIKSISILVLRQIYIRDSRRRFLGEGFWLMTGYFDMDAFIPIVVEEEKRRLEAERKAMDADSDEEEEIQRPRRDAIKTYGGSPVSVRLEMLRKVPQFMPFEVRLKLFQAFVTLDREVSQSQDDMFGQDNILFPPQKRKANIRRDHLLEDAFEAFDQLGKKFKGPIRVTFHNEYGPEVGIDGGGITKEFLTSVCREAFQPSPDDEYDGHLSKRGLFSVNKDQLLYPNPIFGVNSHYSELSKEERREGLNYIRFLGKVIGKCLSEEVLVDVEFALFFLQKLTGMVRNSFDDMYTLDPEVYNNLVKVHNYPGDVERDLSLDFTVTQAVGHGKQVTIPLVKDGSKRPVTNANRLEYIHAVANYKLNTVLQLQTAAFLQGMSQILNLHWLTMFNGPELQMLISGGSAKINLADLKANSTLYGFEDNSPTITHFWEVLDECSEEDKSRFINFVTSVPKAPLLGFSVLRPKFAIRNAGNDPNRLPTASTCVNLLKLPDYGNKTKLREKLLKSIRADAGFDLS